MKSLITTLTSCILIVVPLFGQLTITKDSLIAYYNFDSNANNQLNNKYHLSVAHVASYATPAFVQGGKLGNAVEFNGNNALINLTEFGQKIASASNKSLSISFWVSATNTSKTYPTFVEAFESMFLRRPGSPEYGIATSANNGTGTPGWTTGTSTSIEYAGWQHFALVFDSPNKKFTVYKNGNQLFSTSTTHNHIHMTNQIFVVGAGTNSGIINYSAKGAPSTLIDEMYVFNRALSATEVTELSGLVAFPVSSVPNNNLLAYYPFDSNYQNAFSGNYHLSKASAQEPTFVAGKKGSAVSLNLQRSLWNQTEYGQYYTSASNKSVSVSVWIYRDFIQTSAYNSVFEFFESMYLRLNLIFGIAVNSTQWLETVSQLSNYAWQHVVTVYDSNLNQTQLYINGLLKATQNGISAFHKFNDIFVVGGGINNGILNSTNKGFIGLVDEMYIFNRVLTREEISGLTNMVQVADATTTNISNIQYRTIRVFQNKATDEVQLSCENKIVKAELFDVSGKLIKSEFVNNQHNCAISIQELGSGIYLLKTHTNIDTKTVKLHINR